MKICIDARWIYPEISGIGLYTQELIRALARLDRQNEYLILFDNPNTQLRTISAARLDEAPNFSCVTVRNNLFALRNQLALPLFLRRQRVDVYHSTNYMMPLLSCGGTKRVVTIHDLIPLMFRDHAPKAKKARFFPVFKRLMLEVAQRADRIIAVSEATKRDLVRELNVPAEKVSVTLEGVTTAHIPLGPAPRISERRVLFVGRRDPYKNLPLLIQAFSNLRSQIPDLRLRIIGPADDRYPEAPTLAKQLGLTEAIDWIGYATPEGLISEYQQADVFVLPSKYEGFGLTVLEAMACGLPVVCSNVSSLPEVVGDAGLLVPPDDAPALAGELHRVLTDAHLAADLRRRGLLRAGLFTWEKTARDTLTAYEKA